MAENIRRHLKDTVTIEKLKNSTSNDFDDDILQKTCAAAKETDPPEAPKFVSCAELNSKDTSRVTGSLGSTSSGGKPPSGSEAKE